MRKIFVILSFSISIMLGSSFLNIDALHLQHDTINDSNFNSSISNGISGRSVINLLEFEETLFSADSTGKLFVQVAGARYSYDHYQAEAVLAYREVLNYSSFFGANAFYNTSKLPYSSDYSQVIGIGFEYFYKVCLNLNFYLPLSSASSENFVGYYNTKEKVKAPAHQNHFYRFLKSEPTKAISIHLSNILIPLFGVANEISMDAYIEFSKIKALNLNYGLNVQLNIPVLFYDKLKLEVIPKLHTEKFKTLSLGLSLGLVYEDFKKSYDAKPSIKKPIVRNSKLGYKLYETEKQVLVNVSYDEELTPPDVKKDDLGFIFTKSPSTTRVLGNKNSKGMSYYIYEHEKNLKESRIEFNEHTFTVTYKDD